MNSKFLQVGFILLSFSLSLKVKSEIIQVKIFFDKNWSICKSDKASYYRLCGWNTIDQFFEDVFSDYLLNGTKIVQGKYEKGKKKGEFIFYNETGSEKIRGAFKNDNPDSLWTWYYPNNKINYKISFNQDEFDFLEINDVDGNSVLSEKYFFKFKFQNDNSNSNFQITGIIENKLKEGKWKIINNTKEVGFDLYENGKCVKTVSENSFNIIPSRVINNALFVPFSIYASEKLEIDYDVSDTDYPFSSRLSPWKPIESAFGIIGDSVLVVFDNKPKYLGGIDGLNKTIFNSVKLSREYLENCRQFGFAYFEIIIDENGEVINKIIIKSPDNIITKIALNSLSHIGRFKPAYQNGKPIKSKLTSRIKFERPRILN